MSPVEYAWTSFSRNAEFYEVQSSRKANEPERIHACQKPIPLYAWLLQKFAKQGDKILDTHVGSASSLIACNRLGYDVWGYEIDEQYYKLAQERIKRELAQGTLF